MFLLCHYGSSKWQWQCYNNMLVFMNTILFTNPKQDNWKGYIWRPNIHSRYTEFPCACVYVSSVHAIAMCKVVHGEKRFVPSRTCSQRLCVMSHEPLRDTDPLHQLPCTPTMQGQNSWSWRLVHVTQLPTSAQQAHMQAIVSYMTQWLQTHKHTIHA